MFVPYTAAVWRATDPATGMMTAPILVENIEEQSCALYWEYELFTERINLFRDLAQAAVPVAGLWDSTGGEPDRSALYNGFLAPRGVQDELRAVLRVGGRPQGYVSLFRAEGQGPFEPAERKFIEGLATPLAKRLRSYAKPVAEPATGDPAGTGLLIFDPAGTLVSANDEARGFLADMPDGPFADSALGLRVPVWVHGTAMQARAIAEERDRGTARIRVRTRAGRWLACHASCVREAGGGLGVSVVVIEPARISEITPLIVEAYELSARELQVTQCLARGLPTGKIAAELYLSPHTVRDHIKAVFEKVAVTSRGELVGKLFTEYYEPLATKDVINL